MNLAGFNTYMIFTMVDQDWSFSHQVRELKLMSESEVTLTQSPIPDLAMMRPRN